MPCLHIDMAQRHTGKHGGPLGKGTWSSNVAPPRTVVRAWREGLPDGFEPRLPEGFGKPALPANQAKEDRFWKTRIQREEHEAGLGLRRKFSSEPRAWGPGLQYPRQYFQAQPPPPSGRSASTTSKLGSAWSQRSASARTSPVDSQRCASARSSVSGTVR